MKTTIAIEDNLEVHTPKQPARIREAVVNSIYGINIQIHECIIQCEANGVFALNVVDAIGSIFVCAK